jgi:TIR domain-containing protein
MSAPIVFISYSHDSPHHKAWVLKLASDLREQGIDVILDRWDLVAGQDISMLMQKGIEGADRGLMICSADYVQKAEAGRGGVGYERLIVTAEVVQSIDTIKFIPILRGNNSSKKVPQFMGPRLYIDFEDDAAYAVKLEELAREIHGVPALSKPPLGENPFSGTPIARTQTRTLGPMGTLPSAEFPDSDWFSRECEKAQQGIRKRVSLTGHMELRVAITHEMSKSQIELLNAVRHSEIRTFGWPIAVTLENREEYRPRPYQDGIRAEGFCW